MSVPLSVDSVDSSALDGMRGFASLHVMAFHLYRSNSVCGTLEMPVFFLLSGFCLVLGYGKTRWDGCTLLFTDKEGTRLDSRKFYQNRFARVGPIYYLLNSICYVMNGMMGIGKEITAPAVFYTLTMTNTWTFWGPASAFPLPFDMPAWTVTTLTGFYAVFPLILPLLQTLTSPRLLSLIIFLFYLQCLPVFLVFPYLNIWYWPTTTNPLYRLPVFVMGMAAGLIRLRGHNDLSVSPGFPHLLHDLIPWHFWSATSADDMSLSTTQNSWRWRVDCNFLVFVGIILVKVYYPTCVPWFKAWHMVGQFAAVYLLLTIIVGLTSDGGMSILGKLFRLRFSQILGKISMAVYLIHIPVRDYFVDYQKMIPVSTNTLLCVTGVTLILSVISTYVIEEPMRKLLRK